MAGALISIYEFNAGAHPSSIPQAAVLRRGFRAVLPDVRKLVEGRFFEIIAGIERITGVIIQVKFRGHYPATIDSRSEGGDGRGQSHRSAIR